MVQTVMHAWLGHTLTVACIERSERVEVHFPHPTSLMQSEALPQRSPRKRRGASQNQSDLKKTCSAELPAPSTSGNKSETLPEYRSSAVQNQNFECMFRGVNPCIVVTSPNTITHTEEKSQPVLQTWTTQQMSSCMLVSSCCLYPRCLRCHMQACVGQHMTKYFCRGIQPSRSIG